MLIGQMPYLCTTMHGADDALNLTVQQGFAPDCLSSRLVRIGTGCTWIWDLLAPRPSDFKPVGHGVEYGQPIQHR